MPKLLYHLNKERRKIRAREDNNQHHDDVISWLNAPLGRGKEEGNGMGDEKFSFARYLTMSFSNDDYYDGVSTACKSH